MARGFLSGVIWGGVVSVAGAGIVSVLADAPSRPDVAATAPIGATAPGAADTSTADAVTDADLVREGLAHPATAPSVDDVSAAAAACCCDRTGCDPRFTKPAGCSAIGAGYRRGFVHLNRPRATPCT